MYLTYLRRELAGRKKQTTIVAAGLAIAIALVIVVTSLAAGVRDAQAATLETVYGVGTDLTVTGAQAEPGQGGQRFDFDEESGATDDDGTTSLQQSRLTPEVMRETLDASTVSDIAQIDGVAAAVGALSLTNVTFEGELPAAPTAQEDAAAGEPGTGGAAQGGPGGGFGGGAFGLDSFTVLGVSLEATEVGPLSAVEITEGRALESGDTGAQVAVLDATYATTSEIAVGDVIEVGGADVAVVGIAASLSADADTAANVYLPLDVAQAIAGVEDVISTIYVQAASADQIAAVQQAIEAELPDATVSSQADLAESVSGSLSSATSLITNMGTWLSVIVLTVAVLLAVLFTISGVSRRTREFGTLKAIGWSNRRVIGQVTGEATVQGLIGGAAGLLLGLAAVAAVNLVGPTITASTDAASGPGGAGAPGGQGGPGGFGQVASTASEVVLSAPVTPIILIAAVALAVAAGLVAGAFGGWRAARLSPAEALRSVA